MSDNDNGDYPEPTPIRTPSAEDAAAAAASVVGTPDPEPEAPEPTPEPEKKSPYLTAAKMMPVDGVIYCLFHTAVHEDTTDPYDSGQEECEKKEHRSVYYRGRKGDIDETQKPDQEERGVIAAAKSADLSDPERAVVSRLVEKAQRITEAAHDSLSNVLGETSDEVQAVEKTLTLLENTARKLDGAGTKD